MPKPIISFKKQPLKYCCNEMFYLGKSFLPNIIKLTDKYDKAIAFTFGTVAGASVAALGEYKVYPPLEFLASKLGVNISLEDVISHSLVATVSAPIIAKGIAPEQYKKWKEENPTYSWGVKGVMTGASIYAALRLYFLNKS